MRDTLVRAGAIVVADILRHLVQQVVFAQNKEEIQALAAQATQETFTAAIGTRRRYGRMEDLDASPGGDPIELWAVFIVIVPDEKAWSLAKRGHLAQLLSCPASAGVTCDREVNHASGCQLDDDEDENVAEPDIMSL